jgi:nicotinamidase-related amidase
MDRLNRLDVPRSLAEACRPESLALLVYDMQVGILGQISGREALIRNIRQVLESARTAGVRTYFTRHITLPVELMGVAQLRMWRAWQGVDRLEEVQSPFLPDAPQTQIIPELLPTASEAVLDKLTMSAFAGTPLELALRSAGVQAVAIVGVATEIGIEPTVRHASDLGFIPIVIADACAPGNADAGARSMETLRFLGDAMLTDTVVTRLRDRGRDRWGQQRPQFLSQRLGRGRRQRAQRRPDVGADREPSEP